MLQTRASKCIDSEFYPLLHSSVDPYADISCVHYPRPNNSEDPYSSLTARVHRLWAERGDFSKVTAASIRAGQHQDQPASADAIRDMKENDSLTPEELWALKQEIVSGLTCASFYLGSLRNGFLTTITAFRNARISAINAGHMIDVLLPQGTPNVPDPTAFGLQPQSLAPSVLHSPLPQYPPQVQAQQLALTLGTKYQSLKSSAGIFFLAAERTRKTAQKSAREWNEWQRLRSKGVRLEARAARRGATLFGKGQDAVARDLVAFCGAEEGWHAFIFLFIFFVLYLPLIASLWPCVRTLTCFYVHSSFARVPACSICES
jgi:Subunit 17 of Mediator complex